MNEATAHTLLAGLTDLEIAEVVGREMGRRNKAGVLFFFNASAPASEDAVHACLAWEDAADVVDLPVPRQLAIFAAVAALTVKSSVREMTELIPWTEEA